MANKPVTVALAEFRQRIEAAINESQLPAFVIEMSLSNYLAQIHGLAEKQTAQEAEAYQEEIAKEASEEA
jgi:hypothetical protein